MNDGLQNKTDFPKEYNRHGYNYFLLRIIGNWAIYEQMKNGRLVAFEVICLLPYRGQYEHSPFRLPSDEEWGKYGFTFNSLEFAEKKLKEMIRVV